MTTPRAHPRAPAQRTRRAFSLVELLIVVVLFVVLLAIGVPAFRALLESSDETMAENALRGGILAARDAAARGGQGQDAAAVFFYDSTSQRTVVVPCVLVGTFLDGPVPAVPGGAGDVVRDVFAPMRGFEPTQLPRRWMARGYAPPNTIDNEWYDTTYPPQTRSSGQWLLPETDFYNWDAANAGANRQTFMIRFEGGTGALKPAESSASLVIAPARGVAFRNTGAFADPRFRLDTTADQLRTVRHIIGGPYANSPGSGAPINLAWRRRLIGDTASDSVLAKPVRLVSLSNDERGLGPALGVRLDRATGSIYRDANAPMLVANVNVNDVTQYINGADASGQLETRARIFSVHRYLGTLQEVTGTIDGQGVGQ
jgi:prepilin-type N-terminal cleavage/methylation domain-containing protein